MSTVIPYGRQAIGPDDIKAVLDVLGSDFLTQGPRVPAFEEAFAARVGAAHAVATSSATSALHVAYLALGIGPGDLVWTSPVTFVATANAAMYCGAEVDFVDVDPASGLMSPDALEAKLDAAAAAGRLPKAVVPVHLTGMPCNMARIGALCRRHDVRVVEDASHAVGAERDGVPIGACPHSDIAVFSFHPVKIVTTGEGGMAVTADADLAATMRLDRSHGVTRDPALMDAPETGGWWYEQVRLGYNYRLTDIAAALGISQLAKLDDFLAARRSLADRYDRLLGAAAAGTGLALPPRDPVARSAWHLYAVRIVAGAEARAAIFDVMRAAGIGVNVHYIPVYKQPWYRRAGFAQADCPGAEAYYSGALSLPMFPELGEAAQDRVVAVLEDALSGIGAGAGRIAVNS